MTKKDDNIFKIYKKNKIQINNRFFECSSIDLKKIAEGKLFDYLLVCKPIINSESHLKYKNELSEDQLNCVKIIIDGHKDKYMGKWFISQVHSTSYATFLLNKIDEND